MSRVLRRGPALGLLVALVAATSASAAGRCGQYPWCNTKLSPDKRAGLLLNALTTDEKISLLGGENPLGVAGGEHTHIGTGTGVDRVGLPTVYYSDGPVGPRQGRSTAMPAPMALAATFDPSLAHLAGETIATEAKFKGNDVVYAPTVNVMRNPLNGRTFEAYGEDPWLVTQLTVQWIKGAQATGVMANVKHFAANNQEGYDPTGQLGRPGLPLGVGLVGSRLLQNSEVDERTLREVYLPQFEAAVKDADSATIMCSYNQLNGQYACENEHLLVDILRREWGFKGYVIADYAAAHNVVASLNNGLDFEPFPPLAYQPAEVSTALATGLASTATLDDHVRNQLRTLFAYGFFDRDAYKDDDAQIDKRRDADAAQRIQESAITLLKNDGGLLPLDAGTLKKVAVIGVTSDLFVTGGGSGNVSPFAFASPLRALRERLGNDRVVYDDGKDLTSAVAAARAADVAIVFAGDYYSEGADRQCLSLECPNVHGDQDALISAVTAAAPKKTVVVLQTGGPALTPWRGQATALLEAWYGGQQGGPALARVLFGDVDASGRLPATFPDSEAQLPTAGDQEKYPGTGLPFPTVKYKEGVFVGYRWYDQQRSTPAFPFGFGLSYTTFALSGLKLDPSGRVSVVVRNTGSRAGIAVPQLYLGLPDAEVPEPVRQLRGAARISLAPGSARRVTFRLRPRDIQHWDVDAASWQTTPGCIAVTVGRHSRDAGVTGTYAADGAGCPKATPLTFTSSRRACTSRRSVTYRLGATATRVTLRVSGRRTRTLTGRRSRVKVDLSGSRRSAVTVRITARTASGRTIRRTSVLHPCTARRA